MAVKQINLDALIDNTTKVEVRLAGKVYPIVINDEMFKKLTKLQTEMGAYLSTLDNTKEKELIEMGESGREELVNGVFDEFTC